MVVTIMLVRKRGGETERDTYREKERETEGEREIKREDRERVIYMKPFVQLIYQGNGSRFIDRIIVLHSNYEYILHLRLACTAFACVLTMMS